MFNNSAIHTDFNRLVEEEKLKSERQKLAALQAKYPTLPDQSNTSLREDLEINWDLIKLKNLSQKFGVPQPWETNAQPTVNGTMGQAMSITNPTVTSKTPSWQNFVKDYGLPSVQRSVDAYNSLSKEPISDVDKHKYVSCVGSTDGIATGVQMLGLGALKEIKDITQKSFDNKQVKAYGGYGGILRDSFKDMGNNMRGVVKGVTAIHPLECEDYLPPHLRYRNY